MVAGVDLEFPHPNYGIPNQDDNDIMLVKLAFPVAAPLVQWNTDPSIPLDGDSVTTIGFGYTEENGSNSQELLKVDVDIVLFEQCDSLFGDLTESIMLCAGTESGGRDACQGDSGGPLLSSSTVQVGIVSFGDGCGQPGVPAVYTRVSAFDNWIQRTICDLSDSPPASCDTLTIAPTAEPTNSPSIDLSQSPSIDLVTTIPTIAPITISPTAQPSNSPSMDLSPSPTIGLVTNTPTAAPIAATIAPSSLAPTNAPLTSAPIIITNAPTATVPTRVPIAATTAPTRISPTKMPMGTTTAAPSTMPQSNAPSNTMPMLPTPVAPRTKAPFSRETDHPAATALPTSIGKGRKKKRSKKGKSGKKSKKWKKSKKNMDQTKNIFPHSGKGKGKGKSARGHDSKVNWSYLLNDDIFVRNQNDEIKSVLHNDYVEAIDANHSTVEEQSPSQPLQQQFDASTLTSVLHDLDYVAGNW